jgi:hypothetical protein
LGRGDLGLPARSRFGEGRGVFSQTYIPDIFKIFPTALNVEPLPRDERFSKQKQKK